MPCIRRNKETSFAHTTTGRETRSILHYYLMFLLLRPRSFGNVHRKKTTATPDLIDRCHTCPLWLLPMAGLLGILFPFTKFCFVCQRATFLPFFRSLRRRRHQIDQESPQADCGLSEEDEQVFFPVDLPVGGETRRGCFASYKLELHRKQTHARSRLPTR